MFWSLSITDISEIARNSVLQSGFPHCRKAEWLGPAYWRPDRVAANDLSKSNIPMIRCQFRQETFQAEQLALERTGC